MTLIEAHRKADSFRASIASGIDPQSRGEAANHPPRYLRRQLYRFDRPTVSAARRPPPNWRLSFHHPCRGCSEVCRSHRSPRPTSSPSFQADLVHPQEKWHVNSDTGWSECCARRRQQGLRSGDNPATTGKPRPIQTQNAAQVRHHPAIPYEEHPGYGDAQGTQWTGVTGAQIPHPDRHTQRRDPRRMLGRDRPQGTGLDDSGRPGEERRTAYCTAHP